MIEDLLSGAVKAQGILVYDRSRFFRDLFQAKYYEEKLKKKGIQVLSVTLPTENLDAPFANAFKNFQDTVNQLQSDMNGLYTLGGMKANARKGFFNGGTPPYGYRVQKFQDEKGNIKSKLEISQEEEGVVQTIFSLYAQGRGAKKVAILLNEEGFRTRQIGSGLKTGSLLSSLIPLTRENTFSTVAIAKPAKKSQKRKG